MIWLEYRYRQLDLLLLFPLHLVYYYYYWNYYLYYQFMIPISNAIIINYYKNQLLIMQQCNEYYNYKNKRNHLNSVSVMQIKILLIILNVIIVVIVIITPNNVQLITCIALQVHFCFVCQFYAFSCQDFNLKESFYKVPFMPSPYQCKLIRLGIVNLFTLTHSIYSCYFISVFATGSANSFYLIQTCLLNHGHLFFLFQKPSFAAPSNPIVSNF